MLKLDANTILDSWFFIFFYKKNIKNQFIQLKISTLNVEHSLNITFT